ncbi:MAG: hypothetical protein KDA92_21100 [Planctomycetales bacterium]|nr:hypothetical protein [Planctomycetales bacterium]
MVHVAYDLLAVITLASHLICMNLAGGLPVLAAWVHGRGTNRDDPALEQVARDAIWHSLIALFGGIVLGLTLAGIMWLDEDRGLFFVLPAFSHKIQWGFAELVFFVACLGIYLGLAGDRFRLSRVAPVVRYLFAILAASNLLYHFPPLFTVMARSAQNYESIPDAINARQYFELMLRGYALPLALHVTLASYAVAAVYLVKRMIACGWDDATIHRRTVAKRLCLIALTVTLLQIPAGIWLLMRFDAVGQSRLMGGDLIATLALGLSILLAFRLMHLLAAAAFSNLGNREIRQVTVTLLLIVLLMTSALRRSEMIRRVEDSGTQVTAYQASLLGHQHCEGNSFEIDNHGFVA